MAWLVSTWKHPNSTWTWLIILVRIFLVAPLNFEIHIIKKCQDVRMCVLVPVRVPTYKVCPWISKSWSYKSRRNSWKPLPYDPSDWHIIPTFTINNNKFNQIWGNTPYMNRISSQNHHLLIQTKWICLLHQTPEALKQNWNKQIPPPHQ